MSSALSPLADPRGREERIQAARKKLNSFRAKRAKLAATTPTTPTTPTCVPASTPTRRHSRLASRSPNPARTAHRLPTQWGPYESAPVPPTTNATNHATSAWYDDPEQSSASSARPCSLDHLTRVSADPPVPAPAPDEPRAPHAPPVAPPPDPPNPMDPPDRTHLSKRNSQRLSRHMRQGSVATKRQSIEMMGGLGFGLVPPERRQSIRRSGVLDAAVLFGSAGVSRRSWILDSPGDRTSALEKLEGRSGFRPQSILESPDDPPHPSGGAKRGSKLRFSLPPSPKRGSTTPTTAVLQPGQPGQQVDQRGSQSSVQLPDFDDLHGTEGMDQRRSSRLIEANEKSTASEKPPPNTVPPAPPISSPRLPPTKDDDVLDTLLEEDEDEDAHKPALDPKGKEGSMDDVHMSPSESRRQAWRQSMSAPASLRQLKLAPAASPSYQSTSDSPWTRRLSTTTDPPHRRMSGLGYKSDPASSSSDEPRSDRDADVRSLETQLHTTKQELLVQRESHKLAIASLEQQLHSAQATAAEEQRTLHTRLDQAQAALTSSRQTTAKYAERLAQSENTQRLSQEEAERTGRTLHALEATLADTSAERDTYAEDVDGWRQRCSDLEANLAAEQARVQTEALSREILLGKAQRLQRYLDRARVEVPPTDRLSARDLMQDPTYLKAASPGVSPGVSPRVGPWVVSRSSSRRTSEDPAHPPAAETIQLLSDMRQQIFTLATSLEREKQLRLEAERRACDASTHEARPSGRWLGSSRLSADPFPRVSSQGAVLGSVSTLASVSGSRDVFTGEVPRTSSPLEEAMERSPSTQFLCPAEAVERTVSPPSGLVPAPGGGGCGDGGGPAHLVPHDAFCIATSSDVEREGETEDPTLELGLVLLPEEQDSSAGLKLEDDGPGDDLAFDQASPSPTATPSEEDQVPTELDAQPHDSAEIPATNEPESKQPQDNLLDSPVPPVAVALPSDDHEPSASELFPATQAERAGAASTTSSHSWTSSAATPASSPHMEDRTYLLQPSGGSADPVPVTPTELPYNPPSKREEFISSWSFRQASTEAAERLKLTTNSPAPTFHEHNPSGDFFGMQHDLTLPPLTSPLSTLEMPPWPAARTAPTAPTRSFTAPVPSTHFAVQPAPVASPSAPPAPPALSQQQPQKGVRLPLHYVPRHDTLRPPLLPTPVDELDFGRLTGGSDTYPILAI